MKEDPTKRTLANGRIDVDYGFNEHGKNIRTSYASDADADAAIAKYKKERKKNGEWWASLRPLERDLIRGTVLDIKSQGLTIQVVWADHQRWRKDNQQSITTPMPYGDVVASHKAAQLTAGISERYANEIEGVFLRFGDGRLEQPIHEIPVNDLQVFIDTTKDLKSGKLWSLSTKATQQGRFSGLWAHAINKGWASLNIVERLTKIKRVAYDVSVQPNDVVLNLMAGIMSNELARSRILGSTAISLFGCMRPEEIESKKARRKNIKGEPLWGWEYINLNDSGTVNKNANYVGTIKLEKWHTKVGDKRVIRLQQTCVDWLNLAKEYENDLPPINERKIMDMVCEIIGLENWVHDWMRQNCATHLRAVYKDDFDVVKDLGNSQRVLVGHYADLHVSEAISLDHWTITPERVKAYMKTKAWKDMLIDAATKRAQKANETAKSAN